jgi:hypothetical protein
MGGVLLSTGGLAVLSAAFAVHMALGVWWPFALLAGLGWSFVIVNLDRMLVVGMAHDASLKRNLLLAVPRVGLALVLGVVIATPLTLQVFSKEIDTEVVTMQAEAADSYRTSLESDERFAGLPALRDRITAAEASVASGGRSDAGLPALRDQATAAPRRRPPASSTRRPSASWTAPAVPATPARGRPTCGRAPGPTRRPAWCRPPGRNWTPRRRR